MPALTAQTEQGFVYLRSGEETPGQRYARTRSATLDLIKSSDPKEKAIIQRVNGDILRLREVGPGQVQDNRFLSNLSLQYKNDDYIGEILMPPVQTPALAGEYPTYDKRSRFAAPDDTMTTRATPNEVSDARGVATYACTPRALTNHVSVLTLRNQQAPLDEMVDLTEAVSEDMALLREQRISTVLTTSGNYLAANVQTVAAGSRWNDATGGNPISDIQNAVAVLFNGHGPSKIYGWCGLEVWNVLSRHPAILDLFKYGGGSPGLATPDMIAKFFGLDGMLVARARQDIANQGQTASYTRIWGKSFGVTRVAARASIRNAAYGSTFRFGNIDTRVWFDQRIGTLGGYWATVSVHEQHAIVANDTGALIVTPVN